MFFVISDSFSHSFVREDYYNMREVSFIGIALVERYESSGINILRLYSWVSKHLEILYYICKIILHLQTIKNPN